MRHADSLRTQDVLDDVYAERYRQDIKWGVQDHSYKQWLVILMEEVGEVARAIYEYEFNGKDNLDNYRDELVQVAAVAVCAIENLDRDRSRE